MLSIRVDSALSTSHSFFDGLITTLRGKYTVYNKGTQTYFIKQKPTLYKMFCDSYQMTRESLKQGLTTQVAKATDNIESKANKIESILSSLLIKEKKTEVSEFKKHVAANDKETGTTYKYSMTGESQNIDSGKAVTQYTAELNNSMEVISAIQQGDENKHITYTNPTHSPQASSYNPENTKITISQDTGQPEDSEPLTQLLIQALASTSHGKNLT